MEQKQITGNINPFTDVDYFAAISRLFGGSGDVLPGYDNVNFQVGPGGAKVLYGTDANAPGGSKYTASDSPQVPGVPQLNSNSISTGTNVGGSSTTTPLNQAAVDALMSSLNQLGTLERQGIAEQEAKYGNLIRRYDDEASQNRERYDRDLLTTNQNHAKNTMQSLYAGAGGLQSLLSILRAQGASQGTARDSVFDTVSSQTARDIAGGDQTRTDNANALENFINTFLSDDENRRAQAMQTRDNNINAVRANTLTNRQGFYNRLADVYGDAGNTAEAQRYAADAVRLNPDITRLSNRGVAEYTPVSSDVRVPELNSFAGPSTTGISATGGSGSLGSGVFTLGDFRERLRRQGA